MTSALAGWTRVLNDDIRLILPLRPQRNKGWLYKDTIFEYIVGRIKNENGILEGVVHMRVLDRQGTKIPIDRGMDVVNEIGYHSNQEYRAQKSQWELSQCNDTPIEKKSQIFYCVKPNCKSFIRTVCWKPLSPNKKKYDVRYWSHCEVCNRGGHRHFCCCIELGYCRLNFKWEHNHDNSDT